MKIFQIILMVFLSFSSHADEVFVSNSDYPHFFQIESYIDETAALNINQVVKLNQWSKQDNHFAFGYSSANFWLKFTFSNASSKTQNPILWLTETFFHEVTFYEKQNDKWLIHESGLRVPVGQREVLDTFSHYQLALKPNQPKVIYIKLNGEYGSFGAFVLNTKKDFYTHMFARSMVFVAIIIALIMLSLFYLVLHLYLKEISFIYYSLYSLSYSVWIALYNGLIPMFFDEWVHSFLQIFMPLAFIFLIKFSQSILDTPKHNPKIHLFLNLLVGLYIIAVLIIPFEVQTGFMIHNVAVTITMPVLMLLSLISLRRKERMVSLYAIGLFAYFAGMIVLAQLALGSLPYNILTRNAPFPGSVIEFAFFAYILALKVFQLQDEKEASYQYIHDMQQQAKVSLTKKVEERTVQLQKVLDKKQKMIQQYSGFISLITHELRNPLGIIKSQIALLKKEREKGVDNVDNRLKTLSMTTQRMELLFDDWLVSDKLENELFACNIEAFELSEWLSSMEGMVVQIYSSHRFKFVHKTAQIYADSSLLKLAIYNLIDNAVKYSRSGSTVLLSVELYENRVDIVIEDKGKGVAANDADVIFDRFMRGKNNKGIQGSGLGLFLVKKVMELHQGRVYLDSEYKKGSRFVLSFKRKYNEQALTTK